MMLYEKVRPRTWDEFIGQPKVVRQINHLRSHGGLQGRVFWIVGESGQGKTTAARLIATEIADSWAIIEKDAQEFSMDFVRELERMCQYRPLGKGCNVFICNEAHRLSDKVVSRLQTVLEDDAVQRNSTWIFTTTTKGQARLFDDKFDACPFLSRAVILEFGSADNVAARVVAYASHVRDVAQREGLDGRPLTDYIALVKANKCNLRACFNAIETGAML